MIKKSTLFCLLLCFGIRSYATSIVDFSTAEQQRYLDKILHSNTTFQQQKGTKPATLLPGFSYKAKRARSPLANQRHTRFIQTFNGIPVWGMQAIIHSDYQGNAQSVSGKVAAESLGQSLDRLSLAPRISTVQALAIGKQFFNDKLARKNFLSQNATFSQEQAELYYYLEEGAADRLIYEVKFVVTSRNGFISHPLFLIDANTGGFIDQWEYLKTANGSGPGGNDKIGQYEYGVDYDFMDITENGGICSLENANVRTLDLNHGTSGGSIHTFNCFRNDYKSINGAYSPLNDAHFFGTTVFNAFQNWYGSSPLSFQLEMRVHYGSSYENAFWNGSSMTFGDGGSRFHPLVSLDVVAHEVAHGVTDQNSDLIYSGQSGGINEAFSDMAGEAVEFYLRGSNDWLVGADIMKSSAALRYFEDPTLDGRSIGHASDYYNGMGVHFSSGVYNRAFYLLANTAGWDVKKAFDVMVDANRNYWIPSTTFEEGLCGIISATVDRGYDVNDVIVAFDQVGVSCANLPHTDSDGDLMSDFWELQFGLDPSDPSDASMDLDSDGLTNLEEFQANTYPNEPDTDTDGLTDFDELNVYNTIPSNPDTDDDGLVDGDEISASTDPLDSDSDSDGMPDGWEVLHGLNPLLDDSADDPDGDGRDNLTEFNDGTNPSILEVVDSEPNNTSDTAQSVDGTFHLGYSNNIGDRTSNTSTLIPHTTIIGSGDSSFDYYSFSVSQVPSKVIFDVDNGYSSTQPSSSFDSYLRLIDSSGSLIAANDDASTSYGEEGSESGLDSFLEFEFQQPGTYVIEVAQYHRTPIRTGASYLLHISLENSFIDTDGDGIPDDWENQFGLNPNDPSDASLDPDADNLTNSEEYAANTDPTLNDTDGDGLNDGQEVKVFFSDPLLVDSDGDTLSDYQEVMTYNTSPLSSDTDSDGITDQDELNIYLTNPVNADTDGDGLEDGWEVRFGFDPTNDTGEAIQDTDGDGLSNVEEQQYSTSPLMADTDGDGLSDGEEVNGHLTDPTSFDSDLDFMPDGWEVNYSLDALTSNTSSDTDGDGWTDLQEYNFNSQPNNASSLPVPFNALAVSTSGAIHKINLLTGEESLLVELNELGSELQSIAMNSRGLIYGLSKDNQTLYLVDIFAKSLDEIGSTGLASGESGMTFTDNGLVAIVSSGQQSTLYSLDTATGAAAEIGALDVESVDSLAWDGQTLFGLLLNGSTRLFAIDESSGKATLLGTSGISTGGASGIAADHAGTLWAIDEQYFRMFNVHKSSGAGLYRHQLSRGYTSLIIERDQDSDGIPDYWEAMFGFNPNDASDAGLDDDSDGLTNLQEYLTETLPDNPDTDADGINDGTEVNVTLSDPTDPDSDKDSISDGDEYLIYNTSPINADTDGDGLDDDIEVFVTNSSPLSSDSDADGMSDYFEVNFLLDPNDSQDALHDEDGDGLNNLGEFTAGTIPINSDTDNDGLKDGLEVLNLGSDPTNDDTDSDGMPDEWEYRHSLDLLNDDSALDPDSDGWSNLDEYIYDTDPNNPSDLPDLVFAYSISSSNNLYRYELNSGSLEEIGYLNAPGDFEALAFDNSGTLYAADDELKQLWEVSKSTGEATLIGTMSLPQGMYQYGMTAGPNGMLFLVGGDNNNALYSIDPTSAAATLIGQINAPHLDSLAWDGTSLFGMSSNGTSNLYQIDHTSATATLVGKLSGVSLTLQSGMSADAKGQLWGLDENGSVFKVDKSDGNTDSLINAGHYGFESLAIQLPRDSDGDGMPDVYESRYGLDPNEPTDAQLDSDSDGLINLEEYHQGTSPIQPDTDGDGIDDGNEVNVYATSPLLVDTDSDGLGDGYELTNGLNPLDETDATLDRDGDGLSNFNEFLAATDLNNPDTDGDGMPDGWEVRYGLDPTSNNDASLDLDGDGLSNLEEYLNGTQPNNEDSDGDGIQDAIFVDSYVSVINESSRLLSFHGVRNGAVVSNVGLGSYGNWTPLAKGDFVAGDSVDFLFARGNNLQLMQISNGGATRTDITLMRLDSFREKLVGVGDFDGDGQDDWVISSIQNDGYAWYSYDAVNNRVVQLGSLNAGIGWKFAAAGDFNGDGTDDMLFRDMYSRNGVVHVMNAGQVTQSIDASEVFTFLSVIDVADINADGTDDVVFRYIKQGDIYYSLATNGELSYPQLLSGPTRDTIWRLAEIEDYDADGYPDLLWSHPDGRVEVQTQSDGTVGATSSLTTFSSSEKVFGPLYGRILPSQNVSQGVRNDHDRDGYSDITFVNESNGRVRLSTMVNLLFVDDYMLGNRSGDWEQFSGDFNGDAYADMLWRDNVTGEWQVELMSASGSSTSSGISGEVEFLETFDIEIIGVWDFNRDGADDVVAYNSVTEELYLALMDGSEVAKRVDLGQLSGVEIDVVDFFGDGQGEILLKDTVTGELNVYEVNSNSERLVQGRRMGQLTDLSWSVEAVGDFDGDGDSDLIWKNSRSNLLWFDRIEDKTFVGGRRLLKLRGDWRIQDIGDYNGDGTEDVLFYNTSTTRMDISFMDDGRLQRSRKVLRAQAWVPH